MANIENLTEAWNGHSGLEVETFIKAQLTALAASIGGKFGHVAFNSQTMMITFYDQPGGTVLGTVQLGGQVYTIDMACNLPQVFYVLADETEKVMTITPSTSVSSFGSSTSEPFPEPYTYVVAVNSGSGYVDRVTGNITTGGSASFDLKPFLATGDNYVRVSVTGTSSGQTRTTVFTGTLTTLTMSCNHTWQNVWTQGTDYNITGIRFAGNLIKELHVSLDNVELAPVTYSASQSYTTTSTFYTIPASAFPSGGSAVHSVKLWMSAQGVSTPQISYNIMCAASGDTTPLVAINAIASRAYNFTSGTIFSYAVYNANKVTIDMSATLNSIIYPIASAVPAIDRESGVQYPFAYSLEVDTGANETKIGSLAISAKAYMDSTEGVTTTASTIFDNTYSYLATPGALFYLNAATRDNGTANREVIVNEAGASQDGRFAASYQAVWSGLSWYNDGWGGDNTQPPLGPVRALSIPAGCSVTVTEFNPLALLPAYNGMTIEMMLQCGSPSDYSEPVFSISSGGSTPLGILIYPTKITVWGSSERDEDYQTVNFSENTMTHVCITILKGYEGESGKNLCSVYINGISNVCFEFKADSSFGNGSLVIGQAHTDAYLYKMRVYGVALESGAVFNNFLNCLVDGIEFNRANLTQKNDVLLGSSVNYDLVKRAGFNTMVVITPNNEPIPDVYNKVTIDGCTVRFEYAGQQTKNATVTNLSMDGQGTTSKKYYRWNLRWKTGSDTTWVMGDGTTLPQGKTGRMINDLNYVEVDRITAKKNIASSPQGHKMGLTGLYNDLFHQVGLGDELPDPDYRVAVYQFPFVGFQYNSSNQSYQFIGIYTCGPDKGSKVTFGYLKSYADCLSIEGPNHAPRGTRFLCPWVDVEYNHDDETLTFGGEEGWDCDYVKYETTYGKNGESYPDDWAAIFELYDTEWQPAYNCVYDNSPYLASYQEVINDLDNPNIETLADLLSVQNASSIRGGKTNGMIVKNEFIAFYDSSYDLYFYRRSTGKYEKLPASYAGKKNALTDLAAYLSALGYSTSSPTTAQIIEARGARFKATMGNYFSVNQTLFHYCFCLLYGVTDNFAKNSYPFKFQRLATSGAGNRWGWRQDDLDSVLMTDNNGTNTKSYSVEHLDTFDDEQIFQGGESALWVLVKENYEEECASMMGQIASAATALATSLGIAGNGPQGSLFNLTAYHCWEHSSKYFPATVYESDRRWSYIEPWLLAGQTIPGTGDTYPATYNGVYPLTQALGDQFQGEKLWVERRIAYIFSKYLIGPFHAQNDGYGAITFTLARTFEFHLTPAIDLYPSVALVNDDVRAGRTTAGSVAVVEISTSGGSNNEIHGGDWLASLGDLHRMRLTSRGGSSSIPFDITGARLQELVIGNEDAENMEDGFNATVFGVTSPTLVELDARNTATIGNTVDLLGCPRLRRVLFAGSGAAGLYLPVGAKLTEVSFPSAATVVFMHSLPFLENEGLTLPALGGITNLYINNCAQLEPFAIVADMFATPNYSLAYVTIIWSGIVNGDVDTIIALAELAGYVTFENNTPGIHDGKPDIEGTVQIPGAYVQDLELLDIVSEETYQTDYKKALSNLFGTNFYIVYDPDELWIRFADPAVETICLTNWDTSGDGKLTVSEAKAVKTVQGKFKGNTSITSFDEFKYFIGLNHTTSSSTALNQAFMNCTNLKSISFPFTNNVPSSLSGTSLVYREMCYGCSNLERIYWPFTGNIACQYAFAGTTKLKRVDIRSIAQWSDVGWGGYNSSYGYSPFDASKDGHLYLDDEEITDFVFPDGAPYIRPGCFRYVKGLVSVVLPNTLTQISGQSFYGASNLTSITFRCASLTVSSDAFLGCSSLSRIVLEDSTAVDAFSSYTWSATKGYPFTDNSAGGNLYDGDGNMITSITIPSGRTAIKPHAFYRVRGLQSITLPQSITTIGDYAFAGCRSLNGVTLPSSLTSIGSYAFDNCAEFGDFEIPSSVVNVPSSAFNACGKTSGNHTLTINGSVNALGQTVTLNYKKVIIGGDVHLAEKNAMLFRYGITEELRVAGNVDKTTTSSIYGLLLNSENLKFCEVIGTFGSGSVISYGEVGKTGIILHLGYNGIAASASQIFTSTRWAMIYVGDGTSQAGDEAVLNQYLADSAWASYSSKLATWWSYTGEYKN